MICILEIHKPTNSMPETRASATVSAVALWQIEALGIFYTSGTVTVHAVSQVWISAYVTVFNQTSFSCCISVKSSEIPYLRLQSH